jgi:hypothetical protein
MQFKSKFSLFQYKRPRFNLALFQLSFYCPTSLFERFPVLFRCANLPFIDGIRLSRTFAVAVRLVIDRKRVTFRANKANPVALHASVGRAAFLSGSDANRSQSHNQ